MIHLIHNCTRTLSAFPCGRTQHVRCMCSSIVSMIQPILEFIYACDIACTLVLKGDRSYISGNISSPFLSAKNAFVTAYLLKSSPARFKINVTCCFETISCLLRFKRERNGSPQPLVYFLPCEREQEVHKCNHPK